MGTVLDEGVVYVVMTIRNGYKNIYGHVLFSNAEDADGAKSEAVAKGCWDEVYVTRWKVE